MPSSRVSAGVLLHRLGENGIEVLLVHPGGPFWARKDLGAWSLPKGELEADDEEPRARALAEFHEETGTDLGDPPTRALGEVRLRSGKRVVAFAVAGDLDADAIVSNAFEMVWPPRSGRRQSFPEVDRAAWFTVEEAKERLNPAQAAFLDRL